MPSKKEFVVAGYVVRGDKVLLIHHKKLGMWLPPGGHIETNETPEEAVVREIREETGFDVEVVREVAGHPHTNVEILAQPKHIQLEDIKGTHEHIDLVYVCRVVGGKLSKNREVSAAKFFTMGEIANLEGVPLDVRHYARIFLRKEADRTAYDLPVFRELVSQNKTDFSGVSLLVIQHLKKNTIQFIKLLKEAGFKKITVIGKPYSIDKTATAEIKKYATVLTPSFQQMESLSVVENAVKATKGKFICFDLGGYFTKYFKKSNAPPGLLGVIEDTKNGIWFGDGEKFDYPLFSVASSELKNHAESFFVAKAIVRNTENILINSFQETLAGKHVLVVGYGTIGTHAARILEANSHVYVYDIDPIRLLRAKVNGYEIIGDAMGLSRFDVIIGLTGEVAITDGIKYAKNGVILVNGTTRKREFDASSIESLAKREVRKKHFTKYALKNGKSIYLLADGYPINFMETESVPEFILDIIFSEMFVLCGRLMERPRPGFYPIEKTHRAIEQKVAAMWLGYWA